MLVVRMRVVVVVLYMLIWVYWSVVMFFFFVSEIWVCLVFIMIIVFRKVYRNRLDKFIRYEFGNWKFFFIKVFINFCFGLWEELLWLVIFMMYIVNYEVKEC